MSDVPVRSYSWFILQSTNLRYSARRKADRKAPVVSFPANPASSDVAANWLAMDNHLQGEHPNGYKQLLKMSEGDIMTMKQKIQTSGGL